MPSTPTSTADALGSVAAVDVMTEPLPALESTYARDLPELCAPWRPQPVAAPALVAVNDALAVELGLDVEALRSPEGVARLVGNEVPDGARPVAMGYAGHQFGGFSPRLGDGRAVLLGELVDAEGRRRDLHLKGSGRTTFARGGDGRAALGPMLREHVISEALHALGIPTTRSLAVTTTGEEVVRDTMLPGAVLARVAASHVRVGTFQYAALHGDVDLQRRLVEHAIARHHPPAAEAERPAVALLDAVVGAQASLVASWMLVGFVHGVMNTDNVTISGETIDYGPCAFVDAYDPATVFSSIDHGGRYALGEQPRITQWNLARLAEALLPLVDDDVERAVAQLTEVLDTFPDRYEAAWGAGMAAKLGLSRRDGETDRLATDLLDLLASSHVDLTTAFRSLSSSVRGDPAPSRSLFDDAAPFDAWIERWQALRATDRRPADEVAAGMDAANPIYIPRNHLVEAALAAATAGELGPLHDLLDAVRAPYDERPGRAAFAEPAPASARPYRTFCGT